MSVRADFADMLAEDFSQDEALEHVRVVATERPLDDVRQTTLLIRARSIARTPSAPLSHRDYGLLLTIIAPNLDADKAQDELDEVAGAVLDYLDTRYLHEEATATSWGGERLAYDIPVTVISSKE